MSRSNDLVLKPIGELLSECFYIPAYQRGYRWNERQVVNLLEDIKEFQQLSEEGSKDAFYCLQPIVVKEKKSDHNNIEWELVDGQQRLTTIHIILIYLKEIAALLGKSSYKIRYETRSNSQSFLDEIDMSRSNENIDFFHICEARDAIEKWFEAQDGTYKLKFLQTLLNDDEIGKNVKVIWYQINEHVDATMVFSRLNIGKISLTNAELVKALFLRSSNFFDSGESNLHLNQLKIAHEWDAIEKQLQDNAFWYFISNKTIETNRIEFILQLAAEDIPSNDIPTRDELFTFLTFNQHFVESNCRVEDEWLLVKRYFMIINEWFNDRVLFHLIGFLVFQNESISSLMALSRGSETREGFRTALIARIFKKTFPILSGLDEYDDISQLHTAITEELGQLTYKSLRSRLLPILLLFNVASLLENPSTNSRFQFNRFKSEAWDIEHIRSVASKMPESKENQKEWLNNVVEYISNVDKDNSMVDPLGDDYIEAQDIRTESLSLLEDKTFNSIIFESLFNRVLALYDPYGDEEIDQSIGNLTLLDSSTNRSYQNAVFPIKRSRIILLDKSATFVPLCTKNAFLKYYSHHVDKMMFWEAKDSQDHQQAMTYVLVNFFSRQGA